jgi:hypothetical protein
MGAESALGACQLTEARSRTLVDGDIRVSVWSCGRQAKTTLMTATIANR